MISNIRFGNAKKAKWISEKTSFYVYHNLSETTLINKHQKYWFGIQVEIEAILSHETLHKVIFKLEGGKVSSALDKWCRKRKWFFNDDCGVCFTAKEIGDDD